MFIKKIVNGNLNEVYFLKINKNEFILRSTIFNNDFEVAVLKYINNKINNIPHIITNFKYQTKNISVLKYIKGRNPKQFTTTNIISLTKIINELHHINIKNIDFKDNNNFESIEKINYYKKNLNSKYYINNKNFLNDICKECAAIDFENLPKCLIHSDIKKNNVIVNKEEVFLIDFGNCYIGSRLVELIRVIMWFFLLENKNNKNKVNIFLKEYFKNNTLLLIEKKYLLSIIKFSLLYNFIKDVYLFENNFLDENYVINNDLRWLNILKDNNLIDDLLKSFLKYS